MSNDVCLGPLPARVSEAAQQHEHEKHDEQNSEPPHVVTSGPTYSLAVSRPNASLPSSPAQDRGVSLSRVSGTSTGSTCTVTTRSCVTRVTNQSRPFRRIVSPIEGRARRVKSYSKSPFGNRITYALAGTGSPRCSPFSGVPVLTNAKPGRRQAAASRVAPGRAEILCQAVLDVPLPLDRSV
jgi:hypothetical protein